MQEGVWIQLAFKQELPERSRLRRLQGQFLWLVNCPGCGSTLPAGSDVEGLQAKMWHPDCGTEFHVDKAPPKVGGTVKLWPLPHSIQVRFDD